MELKSNSFEDNGFLPSKFAKSNVGENISPQLSWAEEPPETKSFALSLIDKSANDFIHWEVINIPGDIHFIEENASGNLSLPGDAAELPNSFGGIGYAGPKPPTGTGPHKYVFTLYAISKEKIEPFSDGPLDFLIKGKVLETAKLTALFEVKAEAA